MITKHRNWALLQIVIAVILSASLVFVFHKSIHTREGASKTNLDVLGLVLYVASYAMWVIASLSLARAKGYQRDAMGALFMIVFIVGFCIPILPLLFPFFIIFGLEDKTKDRMRRR